MENIIKNKLQEGMIFDNPHIAADFIGYTKSNRNDLIYRALKHYCEFHTDKNKKVYIDKVFESPIPFSINDFVYNIGDVLENKFGQFQIRDRYIKMKYSSMGHQSRIYFCQCLNEDKTEFEITRQQIDQGSGCPCCGKNRVIPGHSFYDEHPELHSYIVDIEAAKKYTSMSSKKILFRCIYCGANKYKIISNVVQYGFVCDNCSDGISYPNKFIQNLLDELDIKHEPEHSFIWSNKKIYDQYLEDYNCIIENHGKQHYIGDINNQFPFQNLDKQQYNDNYKFKLAKENGIDNYIILDCSYSTLDWMKNSIMNSELPILLNFKEEDIDWENIHEKCCTSKMHKVWELWNEMYLASSIAKILGISDTTVRTYIHKGIECGKCRPFPSISQEEYIILQYKEKDFTNGSMKPIYNKTDDIYYASRFECEKYHPELFNNENSGYNLYSFINKNKPYKGKEFIYITKEEFNRKLLESYDNPSMRVYGNPFRNIKYKKGEINL